MALRDDPLAWSVEAVVSVGAAWAARSPALLGFGGDSAVNFSLRQLCSAILFNLKRTPCGVASGQSRKWLALYLPAFVTIAFMLTLLGHVKARRSPIGIVLGLAPDYKPDCGENRSTTEWTREMTSNYESLR